MIRDKTTHIVIHTAAWPGDPSVEDIRKLHIEQNGWDDIGYHYVNRKDGTLEIGRPEWQVGAHCIDQGMNRKSVAICNSGHGDQEPLTPQQLNTLALIVTRLQRAYNIPIEHVKGHHETGANKTCPGTKVDMDEVRTYIVDNYISGVPKANIPDYLKPDDTPETEGDANEDFIPDEKDKDQDGIIDEHEEPLGPPAEFDELLYMGDGAPKKKFRYTDFGRTILGRNAPGKTIYGIIGAAGSVYAGSWFEPVNQVLQQITTGITPLIPNIGGTMEMEILDIVLIALAAIITFITTRGLISGTINEIAVEVKQIIAAIQKAREAASPGGKEITKEEQAVIWKEADDIAHILWRKIIRSRILRWLGLDKTLFDEGKGSTG